MNNSKLAMDSVTLTTNKPVDIKPQLIERETKLVKIVEAIQSVAKSEGWSTLKTEVFENLVNVLERDIKEEAKKESPDVLKLNRLAGQLKWAEKYADLPRLESIFRTELIGIRKNLYGTDLNGQ